MFPSAAALLSVGALACSLESPETPRFDTAVYVPLGSRSVTGQDLIADSDYIEGDSAGTSPLAFVLRGTVQPVEVGRFLDFDTPDRRFEVKLGAIALARPSARAVVFSLRSLHPDFASLPPEPTILPVAPFLIERRPVAVPAIQDLEWARLAAGRFQGTLVNELPVPLVGGAGEGALSVRLTNRLSGGIVFEATLEDTIPPGFLRFLDGNLAGREITGDLLCEVGGSSPGSEGVPVEIRADDQRVVVTASLSGLSADSARARVPRQSFARADSVVLADDVRLVEGEVRAGTIPLVVENGLPFEATARIAFSSLWTPDRRPLVVELSLPPAEEGRSGRASVDVDLAGCLVRSPSGLASRALPWRVTVATVASEGVVDVGARQGGSVQFGRGVVSFDRVTGTMNRRRFALVPTETAVEPPEGIDELRFEHASLELAIESSVGLRSQADLTLTGIPDDGGAPVVLPIGFTIEPPAVPGETRTTRIALDETNSRILSLIAARPRRLRIEGNLQLGVDGVAAEVRRTDSVRGAYTLRAPLRVRIGRVSHRTEPFRLTLDEEAQERIRKDVAEAEATGTVRNHFPAGMTAHLRFGATERSLDLDPATHPDSVLVLGPVEVAPGRLEGSGARVTEETESAIALPVAPERVSFFARDELYGRIELTVSGADADRVVEVTAADYVEVNAMIRFAVRVRP